MSAISDYERLLDGRITSHAWTPGEYLLDHAQGWVAALAPHWWASTQRIGFNAYEQHPAWSGVPYQDISGVTEQAGGLVMLAAPGYPQLAGFYSPDAGKAIRGINRAIAVARTQGAWLLGSAQRDMIAARAAPLFSRLSVPESSALQLRLSTAILSDMQALDDLVSRLWLLDEAARQRGANAEAVLAERRRILGV